MKNLSLEQVGKRLRRIRSQTKLTREQFAEQVGISPQFLAEIENGKKGMSAETLFKICTRFDLSAIIFCLENHLLHNYLTPYEQHSTIFQIPILN